MISRYVAFIQQLEDDLLSEKSIQEQQFVVVGTAMNELKNSIALVLLRCVSHISRESRRRSSCSPKLHDFRKKFK